MGGRSHGEDLPDMERVYDAIAESWARTRSGPWPEVTSFLAGLAPRALVADVGAGGGRYLAAAEVRDLKVVALDFSAGQLAVARRALSPGAALVRADARRLPVRGSCADAALLVAVVHHAFKRGDRVRAIAELRRVLKPGGRALLSAWGAGAVAFKRARRVEGGGERDFLVPFQAEIARPVERFFHAYVEGELAGETQEAGFSRVREWDARSNWFVEAQR